MVRAIGRAGIRHIVALRGDPPGGGTRYEPTPGGYINAADLVGGIRAIGDFEVSVAVYPEKHPESFTLEVDLAMLAAKVDNGATSALTQFFFDNSAYFRFLDRARARGIDIPIIPATCRSPISSASGSLPSAAALALTSAFARRFEGLENSPEERRLVAAAVAAEQVTALRAEGVNSFHFYTLNRADVVFAICRMLGLGGDAHMAAA